MTEPAGPAPAPGATPRFSIVTPVYNPPLDVLQETIASVLAQTFTDWEFLLVDDLSPDPGVRDVLHRAAAQDPRIRVIERAENGHIVKATNDGIDAARGEFIALLDHDDLLVPQALERMATAIAAVPEVDYLYSNENKVDDSGRFFHLFQKPPWSPERLRGQNYACHFSVLRTSLVREVGGFREGFDGSQDHDIILRVTERARRVVHVPRTLYHWRVIPGSAAGDADAKPYAWEAGRRAVQDQLDRLGIAGTVEFGPVPGTYRTVRRLNPSVRVSVVIPTRGDDGLVWGRRRVFVVEAVRSLLERGGHDNLEVVVVHDSSTPSAVLEKLKALATPDLQLIEYTHAFNFSQKCNIGVVASFGDVVVLLNDDVEIESDDFLVQLVAPLFEEGVGMTGARLLYADTTIQHAGLVFSRGHAHHAFAGQLRDSPGPNASLLVSRECTGLTGAAVALRREVYDEVGGLCEELPVNFNDVDLSMKISAAGYRQVWVSNATAFHFESRTRTPVVRDWERDLLCTRWVIPDDDLYLPGEHGRALPGERRRPRGKLADWQ